MIREMFKDMPAVSTLIVIVVLGIAFIGTDAGMAKPEAFYGTVVDKHYKAKRTSVGTGTVMGTDGKFGVVTTTEIDPEEFLIIVKTESGKIVTVKCEPELYYEKEIDELIDCNSYKGLFTGMEYGYYGVR